MAKRTHDRRSNGEPSPRGLASTRRRRRRDHESSAVSYSGRSSHRYRVRTTSSEQGQHPVRVEDGFEAGLLTIIDYGIGQQCNTYQLCIPRPKAPPVPRRPAQDHRLRAFDNRATAWSPQRRRTWRAVWQAVLAAADSEGEFAGDVAELADAASDKLGVDIADETVARFLRWSIAAQLTDQARGGRIPLYRIRA
ncbi:hypothetical protein [Micromonospora sp. NPDC005206]|uniref:hypothetical protein n=1 Tax=Micromonospora sp. NPDC005206 TaxID=3157022 RepID=UPI00339E0F6C